MAGEDEVNVIFSAGAGGKGLVATPTLGGYDPGNLIEIDRKIRHMPAVVEHITAKAEECRELIEKADDFRVIVSTSGESRARAYVAPANGGGIHLECSQSVLLKAAAAMQGR